MVDYRLFVPKQAVGASLVYFDLFNGSTRPISIEYVHPIVSGAVAVTGVLGVDLFLTYTSTVGTGGTAATYDGTDTTAMTFSKAVANGQSVHPTITARLTPTGGATAGAVITWSSVFTEETSNATYMHQMMQMLRVGDTLRIPPNFGIRVIQGAVASVGNIGFVVGFNLAV